MSINLTDEIEVKTKKGKLGAAKQIFLEGDTQTVEKEIKDINSRHDTLNTKHESLSKTVQGISATGKANTATEVTYNNTNSGIVAENIQDAVDKLAAKDATKAEKSDVQSSVSELKAKNTSQDAEIAKKANAADVNSKMQTEQTRVNNELAKKFNSENIAQESGEAEDKVMSQKAVSTKFRDLNDKLSHLDTPNSEDDVEEIIIGESENNYVAKISKTESDFKNLKSNGKEVLTEHQDVSYIEDKLSHLDTPNSEDDVEEIIIGESENNYVAKISKTESDFKNLKSNGKEVLTEHQDVSYIEDKLSHLDTPNSEDDVEEIIIGESENNYVAKINKKGLYVDSLFDKKGNTFVPNGNIYTISSNISEFHEEYGERITIPNDLVSDKLNYLRLFGKYSFSSKTTQELPLYKDLSVEKNGVTVSYSYNTNKFHINGSYSSGAMAIDMGIKPNLQKGKYVLSIKNFVNNSSLAERQNINAMIRIQTTNGEVDKKLNLFNNTLVIEIDDTYISSAFMFYCGTINVDMTFSVMLNKGEVEKELESYNPEQNVIFSATDININIGETTKKITLSEPLRAIPVEVTNTTRKADFTYSDNLGNAFISDEIRLSGDQLIVIRRIGQMVFTEGNSINKPYLSTNIGGLVDGATVYIPKSESQENLDTFTGNKIQPKAVISNSDGLFMYAGYLATRNIIDNPFSVFKLSELKITEGSRSILFDGDSLYCGGWLGKLKKINIHDLAHPILEKEIQLSVPDKEGVYNYIVSIIEDGEYLYIVDRDPAAGDSVSTNGKGYLHIVKKADMAIVNTIELANKAGQVRIYKNHIYVMEQMRYFEIFDMTDKSAPQQIYKHYNWKNEYQKAVFWEKDNHDFMAISGFETGVSFFDITDPASPKELGSFSFTKTKFSLRAETMDIVQNYPYAYFVAGAAKASYRYGHNSAYGIFTIDISLIDSDYIDGTIENNNAWEYTSIPIKYKPEVVLAGDQHPSEMAKIGDCIITNNDINGICLFRIENNVPKFVSAYRIQNLDNNIYPVSLNSNGTFACVTEGGWYKGWLYLGKIGNINF